MRLKNLLILPIAAICCSVAAQNTNPDYIKYIETYKQAAVNQEIIYRIPACITLAQGLLESGAGKSTLAVQANNHFGIKCHSDWEGDTFTHDDETKNECFRKYADPADSYTDHSLFLSKPRYQKLFSLDISDYKGWARGLKECGYATDPNYAAKLINLIETYDLVHIAEATKFSAESQEIAASPEANTSTNVSPETSKKANRKKAASAERKAKKDKAKTNVDNAFQKNNSSSPEETVARSFKERKINPSQVASVDIYVGHQVYRDGLKKYVIAQPGDTYLRIAAEFNIELKRILRYNNANRLAQPAEGQRVYLTGKKK